jgi:hypothetical protein
MRASGMTTSGKRWAAAIAVVIACLLPKHVECGAAGATCAAHAGPFRQTCTYYELEPLAFYLLELVAHRDVGFAYESGDDCR